MVGAVLFGDDPHRGGHSRRVDAVQLQAAGPFVRRKADQPHGLGVALHQRPTGDHFADEQPAAVLAAQPPEGDVGDTRHRRQDHGRVGHHVLRQA
jgi:hypothetical protein